MGVSSLFEFLVRRVFALALCLGATAMLVPSDAQAGGVRKVPDLRRDAGSWMQPRQAQGLRIPVTLHLATEEGGEVMSSRAVQA
ncbi:MAG: hypothetical protein IPK74_36090 [Deltaproteobacteria bacterium]|nr:hypothetical protein [Deltaproteobacteria bacterium]